MNTSEVKEIVFVGIVDYYNATLTYNVEIDTADVTE